MAAVAQIAILEHRNSASTMDGRVTTFVPSRRLDDNVQVMLRFSDGAKGSLWASQIAPGNEIHLRLRI